MSGWKKLSAAAAGAGAEVVNVEDVFATQNYEGNSGYQKVVNGVKLGDGDTNAIEFTVPGTYTWVCPAGVSSVDVVCVGGGGAYDGGGGGGGGLGYKNNISVTAGESYTVRVGEGGRANYSNTQPTDLDSYFISTSTVKGGGGNYSTGGTYTGDGGGNGGDGGDCAPNYGNGGSGSGGGGGGGGQGVAGGYVQYAAGGGVGIYGQGSNGAGGSGSTSSAPQGGGGGSGGYSGDASYGSAAPNGGFYGGGGGTAYIGGTKTSGDGANGAVRIVYRSSSSFPTTDVGFTADGEGHGGLVWTKQRNQNKQHVLVDSERISGGTVYYLSTNNTNAQQAEGWSWSFNGDGYSMNTTSSEINDTTNKEYCSWSWRKTPKFFDIIEYTGDGTNNRAISHNLDSTVGMLVVKKVNNVSNFFTYHRNTGSGSALRYRMNDTDAGSSSEYQIAFHSSGTRPTSTQFYVGGSFAPETNNSGDSYVAYLFAHNDGDATFGPTEDQDIIKCGGFNSGSTDIVDVDLGFEPQWIMVKKSSTSGNWQIFDNLRGMPWGTDDLILEANRSDAESNSNRIKASPTGFTASGFGTFTDYIYMAVRRGPMAVPTLASQVFNPFLYSGTNSARTLYTGFRMDAAFVFNRNKNWTYNNWAISRIRGISKQFYTDLTNAQASDGSYKHIDNTYGLEFTSGGNLNGASSANYVGYFYQRAPQVFEVLNYVGNDTVHTIDHKLGVAPEMFWIKANNASRNWFVYHKDVGLTKYLELDNTQAQQNFSTWANNTAPTATQFTINTSFGNLNNSSYDYIAFLFSSLDGVSKVGSYTGNGSSQTINCGFSSGASYIMIKRIDSTGDWFVWDSSRGIVSGNDPYVGYNISGPTPENNSYDSVDPNSSGFDVVQNTGTNINVSSATYIFHAIA